MRIGEAANDVEEDSMVGITNGRSFSKIFTSWFMQVRFMPMWMEHGGSYGTYDTMYVHIYRCTVRNAASSSKQRCVEDSTHSTWQIQLANPRGRCRIAHSTWLQ